jgi:hypothetical protein
LQLIYAESYILGKGVSSRECLFGIHLAVAKYAKAGNFARESPYVEGEAGSTSGVFRAFG